MVEHYQDRHQAGRVLAAYLQHYSRRSDVLVLGLPRGGVPVAFEVAQELGAALDVFIVRKLGVPRYEELAMGAIASGGVRVLNREVVYKLGIADEIIDAVAKEELEELRRREQLYRLDRPPLELRGKIAILVDDGLATGSTMRAAVAAVRQLEASRVVVAVPVAPVETCDEFEGEVDELVCPMRQTNFQSVGQWYERFGQTSDEEVQALLAQTAPH